MDLNPSFGIMYEELRANQDRIDGCAQHHFPTFGQVHIGMKLDCSRCGGRIDAIHAMYYIRGFIAAGGNPDEILPGWSGA